VQDRQSRDPIQDRGQGRAHGDNDNPVPRLPRGSGFRLSAQSMIRILMFGALLAAVVLLREPCAGSVASFIGQFETQASGDAGSPAGQMPGQMPGAAPGAMAPEGYVRITGDMSDEELENALRQAGVAFDDAGVPDAPGVPAPE
jgi:hypothetical protein